MRNKTKSQNTFPPPLPSSQAQLHSQLLYLPPPSSSGGQGMGFTVSSSHVISAASSSSGAGLITLFPCSSVGSLPRETVLHELLQRGSFPRAAVLHERVAPRYQNLAMQIQFTESQMLHTISKKLHLKDIVQIQLIPYFRMYYIHVHYCKMFHGSLNCLCD